MRANLLQQTPLKYRPHNVDGPGAADDLRRGAVPRYEAVVVNSGNAEFGGVQAQLNKQGEERDGHAVDAERGACVRLTRQYDEDTPLPCRDQRSCQAYRPATEDHRVPGARGHRPTPLRYGCGIGANRGSAIGSNLTRKPAAATASRPPSMPVCPSIETRAALIVPAPSGIPAL